MSVATTARPPLRSLAVKVPEVTALFWLAKLLTTGIGEACSDYFVLRYNPYVVVLAGFCVFAVALVLQFRARAYRPWTYWFAVSMVAVFGTMVADVIHVQFGVPYAVSTAFFAVALACVFAVWRKVEGTLSIHSVDSGRRECFYWLTVVTTFALGTAAGDWTAITLHLGYLPSGLLFGAVILVPLALWRLGFSPVATFWAAYIVTRPLGASFADYLGKPTSLHGLGFGDGPVTVLGALAIVIVIAVIARREPGLAPVTPAGG